MSLYQREGSPYWHYDFAVGGQRFRGSTRQAGKREAARVENELRQTIQSGAKRGTSWTLHQVFAAYWDEHAQHKPSSKTMLGQLATLEQYLGKTRRLGTVNNAALLDYRVRRIRDKLKPHSVNREITLLRAALRHVEEVHGVVIPKLKWERLQSTEPPPRQRYLTFAEWADLIAAAPPSIKPILICAVTTGLRKTNILTMDWSQVRLDARRIAMTVKGGKIHEVRIAPYLAAALSTMPEKRGRVFDGRNFEKRWRGTVKAAGLADLRFHDLRHTFASWARQSGADIADVKEALGHSDISMTMRYAHIKPDAENTAFDRVSDALTAHSAPQSLHNRRN